MNGSNARAGQFPQQNCLTLDMDSLWPAVNPLISSTSSFGRSRMHCTSVENVPTVNEERSDGGPSLRTDNLFFAESEADKISNRDFSPSSFMPENNRIKPEMNFSSYLGVVCYSAH